MRPMNGTKTHPLSQLAISRLLDIARRPIPSQEVNPGIVNRLLREELVRTVRLPSPYNTHRGALLAHLEITDAGRAVLDREGK